MADKKTDLRVKKTQRALVMAMLGLLERQSFGKITVNDLCGEAMVSRSAFYANFEDKYDLLHFCMDVLRQRVFEESEGLPLEQRLHNVLERVRDNVLVFRNLLMADMDTELLEMMRRGFLRDLEHILEEQEGDALPGPADVIAVYYTSGITSVIIYWVSQGMKHPIDEMAACLMALLPEKPQDQQKKGGAQT